MASVVGNLLGRLKPLGSRLFASSKAKLGQLALRGASKRAYTFEVYRRDAAASLVEVAGVYCYARTIVEGEPAMAESSFDIGFVGATANMAAQDAEHDRHGHFVGYDFDILLIQRIDEEAIRRNFVQDLLARYRPALNELLRGNERPGAS